MELARLATGILAGISSRKTVMNHLADETSPYLQQHADNPVDWYPWGPEALAKARAENKPILLSIGYSACHWCHVMAHESFEDPQVAETMNRLYINIKVDREERPDLDKIYQLAHQAITGRGGGWPLTMFLTPDDHVPIFAGTYFPKTPRHGMPGYIDVLENVARFHQQQPDALEQQSSEFRRFFRDRQAGTSGEVDSSWLQMARRNLEASFDQRYGGFGAAPKFPHPTNIERLLRHWSATRVDREDSKALEMARLTLHAMASGGIYDQLGGGFCRYSVDERWAIPHFEKMLYDNGPLLALYAEAYSATGEQSFRRVAIETAEWVMRDMQSPAGGYYSTLDADSEGEEGKFYVWTPKQIDALLDNDDADVVKRHYGLKRPANFEGHWHLVVSEDLEAIAGSMKLELPDMQSRLARAKQQLLAERNRRIHPGRDEKILTSWNGLMIRGMAIAGRRLGRDDFIDSAERALQFIRSTMWRDGRLLATHKDGKTHLNAYLDDYVFLVDGILSLLEARWNSEYLRFAVELIEVVMKHFAADQGGFYFTSDDHEQLLQRPLNWPDEATPSGNGITALVLLRLGYLLAEPRYIEAAEKTLNAAAASIRDYPHAHGSLLHAAEELLSPTEIIVLRGDVEQMTGWLAELNQQYRPARMVLAIPAAESTGFAAIDDHTAPDSGVRAYVCHAGVCEAPVDDLDPLLA